MPGRTLRIIRVGMLHGGQGFKPKVWGGIGVVQSQTPTPTATLLTLLRCFQSLKASLWQGKR